MADVVRKTAEKVFVPLTVGGGIRTIDDFQAMLRAGADKVSVNSAALRRPELIAEAADKFGSQCVVVAIDAKKMPDGHWHAYLAGGREDTGVDAVEWAKQAVSLGAGEILLTSMDADGTKMGFDLPLLNAVTEVVSVPVIASGGCGSLEHFSEVSEKPRRHGPCRLPLPLRRADHPGGQGTPKKPRHPGAAVTRGHKHGLKTVF